MTVSHIGALRIAMANVSGRMPAIGIVAENVASGIVANVFSQGVFQTTSEMANYSGNIGRQLFVGMSGQIVTASGSFNSGWRVSGSVVQSIGMVTNSGGAVISVPTTLPFNLV